MTALESLRAARAAGVDISVEGNDLALRATSQPPDPLLEALSQNKAEIVHLLRHGEDSWSVEDWQVFFDERAGIAEFDGGLSPEQAEAQAMACCVSEWMYQNPPASSPEQCLACHGNDSTSDPLLPFGAETHGHAWLHSRCWAGWHRARKEDAVAALDIMRINDRSKGI